MKKNINKQGEGVVGNIKGKLEKQVFIQQK